MAPLLGTLAVTTALVLSVPTKADMPKDVTAVSIHPPANAQETRGERRGKSDPWTDVGVAGLCLAGGYGLYYLIKQIPK